MSQNLESVQSIYEAFGKGDIPSILGKLSEDVEWEHDGADHGVPWLVPGRGREHVARFFESLSAIEFHHFEPLSMLEGDGKVVALIRVDLKVKATGGRIRDLEAHLWSFGPEGKISRFKHLADTHQHWLAWKGGD